MIISPFIEVFYDKLFIAHRIDAQLTPKLFAKDYNAVRLCIAESVILIQL